jgi:hypothetical protein
LLIAFNGSGSYIPTARTGVATEAGEPIVAAGAYTVSAGGGQSETEAPIVTGQFRVN